MVQAARGAKQSLVHRRASCRCGRLTVECEGEPVRVSVCHCLNCKKRSGSAFAYQARWPSNRVTIRGEAKSFEMTGDSGHGARFYFCADCGSDVYYHSRAHADLVAIPVGASADPNFRAPQYSVYETRKHGWLELAGDIEHHD